MNPAVVTAATAFILSPGLSPNRLVPFAAKQFQLYRSPYEVKNRYCRLFSGLSMADDKSSMITSSEIEGDGEPTPNFDGTQYQVSSMMKDRNSKWLNIAFDVKDDTTTIASINSRKKQKVDTDTQTATLVTSAKCTQPKKGDDSSTNNNSSQESTTPIPTIPDSVLQYERQKRKVQAAFRASKTNVNSDDHLHTVYSDDDIVVASKPSGILCVPGVNKNKSLLDLVFEEYGSKQSENEEVEEEEAPLKRDQMIVHRLDMDTSGIVIFARTRVAMSKLHTSFRERVGTKKVYEALLVGWLNIDEWAEFPDKLSDLDSKSNQDASSLGGGEINLPLQRDHRHPPFMRVSTPVSESAAHEAVKDLNHAGYKKLVAKKPKPSTTQFHILSHETWMGHPVTRIQLTPITGRTHQLRVHCAAMGHPILGDPAYGFCGEAHPNGGFSEEIVRKMSPTCAEFELRRDVEEDVRESGRTMCLHARRLTVDHPVTGELSSFEAAPNF